MKNLRKQSLLVTVIALIFTLTMPYTVGAAVLVNDTFSDGNSIVQNLANNSIRIYKGRNATVRADTVGSVTFDMIATGSSAEAAWGFFTNSGSPVNLGIGDKLSVSGTFSLTGFVGSGQDIRFGVLNSGGTRNANDLTGGMNDASFANDTGYALGFAASGTGTPFTIYRRKEATLLTSPNNPFNTLGDFTAISGTGATARQALTNGTPYTLTYSIERLSASDTKISVSVTGGSLSNLNYTATESSSSPITAFDYFGFRVAGNTFAQKITFTNWLIDYTPSLPVITSQPQPSNLTVQVGSNVTMAVAASGNSLSYEWRKNNQPISGNASAITPTLNLTDVQLADAGNYTAVVTNPGGSVTSNPVTLNVSVDPVPPPPSIVTQPAATTAPVGSPASLSVAATGDNLFYQWFKNGALIPGATQAALNFAGVQINDSADYTVVVSNSSGSITSHPAKMLVVSTMMRTAFAPINGTTNVDIDAPLYITFSQAPKVGTTGKLRVHREDGAVVDTIDMSLAAQSRLNGSVSFKYYPIIVEGNTAAIYLHQKLAYNQSYYVTIEPGVLTDASGAPFVGFNDISAWNFSTKTSAPAANFVALTVAADGSGDFATVQGAIDFVPANNNKRVVITVRKGTYTEIVYVGSNKPFVTVRGEDREQSIIRYANNNNFNLTSTTTRAVFGVDAADFTLENITLRNTTPQGGSQAEAFRGNNNRIVLNRVNLYSFQDTLLLQGQSNQGGFVTDSYIEGDVDFLWGAGAVFFQNTELKMLRTDAFYTQIRNGSGRNGYVFVNCKLTRPSSAITGAYLTRIDPDDFPFSQVVFINTQMDAHIRPDPWRFDNPGLAVTAANYPNIRFWEYNSTKLNGTPFDVSQRHPISRQLTAAEAGQWSDPAFVLGGWSPQTKLTAAVTLSNLTQNYNSSPIAPTVTTDPAGLNVNVTYNGSPTPPSAIGTYSVVATIDNPVYQGSGTGTLVIDRTPVSVTLGNLIQIADGTPKPITVTASPSGVNVDVTYNGLMTPPTAPGSYSVVATINDPNFRGSASATLTLYAPGTQPVKAFPGAEGSGENSRGGRGGDVYRVTNLNDSGVGSLREGIRTASGPRTIVFDVSGTIYLNSRLNINKSFLTIAGQTAPGEGITIAGYPTVISNVNNVIIRYLRFRMGDINCPIVQDDAVWVDKSADVIIDHVSASWSVDETLSVTESNRVTVQWSLITESMKNSCHEKGAHGYGSLIRYGSGVVTYHHNLYAHHDSRNPRLGDNVGLDFVNNVIYNWGGESGYSGEASEGNPRLNYVGNYLVAGPSTPASKMRAFNGGSAGTNIYQSNNLLDANKNNSADGIDNDWAMFTGAYTKRQPARFEFPQIETDSAQTAYQRVLSSAGSSLFRDAVDSRVVSEVGSNGGRHINSQNDVGGYPELDSAPAPADSDQDGMPDQWENENGLNSADPADGRIIAANGYSNLENYLNGLVPTTTNHAPVALADSAETSEDVSVEIDVAANDQDIDRDALQLVSVGKPANGSVVIENNKAVYAPATDFNGSDSFDYTISDGNNGMATGRVTVTINPINDAPEINNVPASQTINELAQFSFTATASDIDSSQLTFSLVDAPDGATIDPNSGQFTWTPTEAQGGNGLPFQFIVRVSDGSASTDADISLTVNEVNQVPVLNSIGNKTVFLGSTLNFAASGSDADIPTQTLSYSLTGTAPAGAAIDPNSGAFSWTPSINQVGSVYTFNVRVTDIGGLFAEQDVQIGVAYEWSNLLSPINPTGGSTFNRGSTIPVKFKLSGASSGISNARARLMLSKIVNGVPGNEFPAVSNGAANNGNFFRYDTTENQYIFNLSTKDLTVGIYQLRIDLGDGFERTVSITLVQR